MTVIEALNDTAKALTNLAKVLVAVGEQTKGTPATESVETHTVIESQENENKVVETDQVTLEQIRSVLAEKSQAGLTNKVKVLLESFGAVKLSAVKTEDYKNLMVAAKELK